MARQVAESTWVDNYFDIGNTHRRRSRRRLYEPGALLTAETFDIFCAANCFVHNTDF